MDSAGVFERPLLTERHYGVLTDTVSHSKHVDGVESPVVSPPYGSDVEQRHVAVCSCRTGRLQIFPLYSIFALIASVAAIAMLVYVCGVSKIRVTHPHIGRRRLSVDESPSSFERLRECEDAVRGETSDAASPYGGSPRGNLIERPGQSSKLHRIDASRLTSSRASPTRHKGGLHSSTEARVPYSHIKLSRPASTSSSAFEYALVHPRKRWMHTATGEPHAATNASDMFALESRGLTSSLSAYLGTGMQQASGSTRSFEAACDPLRLLADSRRRHAEEQGLSTPYPATSHHVALGIMQYGAGVRDAAVQQAGLDDSSADSGGQPIASKQGAPPHSFGSVIAGYVEEANADEGASAEGAQMIQLPYWIPVPYVFIPSSHSALAAQQVPGETQASTWRHVSLGILKCEHGIGAAAAQHLVSDDSSSKSQRELFTSRHGASPHCGGPASRYEVERSVSERAPVQDAQKKQPFSWTRLKVQYGLSPFSAVVAHEVPVEPQPSTSGADATAAALTARIHETRFPLGVLYGQRYEGGLESKIQSSWEGVIKTDGQNPSTSSAASSAAVVGTLSQETRSPALPIMGLLELQRNSRYHECVDPVFETVVRRRLSRRPVLMSPGLNKLRFSPLRVLLQIPLLDPYIEFRALHRLLSRPSLSADEVDRVIILAEQMATHLMKCESISSNGLYPHQILSNLGRRFIVLERLVFALHILGDPPNGSWWGRLIQSVAFEYPRRPAYHLRSSRADFNRFLAQRLTRAFLTLKRGELLPVNEVVEINLLLFSSSSGPRKLQKSGWNPFKGRDEGAEEAWGNRPHSK